MQNNNGLLLLVGLGALFFLGRPGKQSAEEISEDSELPSSTIVAESSVEIEGVPVLVVSEAKVQLPSGEEITETEQFVRRSEQIKKATFNQSAGVSPRIPSGVTSVSQGDIDKIAIQAGEFAYGGAPRPTSTAYPVWNNTYGWFWKEPLGGAVGPGGKQWSPSDTSTNMGSPGTNIGPVLPPGWTRNRGGSANFTGIIEHDFGLA